MENADPDFVLVFFSKKENHDAWYFPECLIIFSRMFDEICEVREVQRNVDWTHVEWINLERS